MSNIKLFNDKKIRTYWDAENEEWYFSVVDIVAVLTESADPKQYIKKMRSRDPELANKWGTICTPVEMYGLDGRRRKIQAMNTEGVLRLVQSIPSPKAEPFKMWLAKVGSERLDEIADPEKAILRGADFYRKKGYPEEWINQRMLAIKTRKKLTDEWSGEDKIDCALMLKKLFNLFGIKKLMLEGGGLTDTLFFDAGLIDEISLVAVPIVDSSKGIDLFANKKKGLLTFKNVTATPLTSGGLWLNYKN